MKKTNVKLTVAVILFVVICLAAYGTSSSDDSAEAPWYGIVPPLLAIMAAFVTKNVIFSLGGAILVGGLLKQVVPDAGSLSAWGAGLKQASAFVWSAAQPWVPADLRVHEADLLVVAIDQVERVANVGVVLIRVHAIPLDRDARTSTSKRR